MSFIIPTVCSANLAMVENRINELTDGIYQLGYESTEHTARCSEYKLLVQWNVEYHGVEAGGNIVDPWMADCYSDLYKDRNGCRPRGHSYRYMKEWMDNIPPLEDDDYEDDYEVVELSDEEEYKAWQKAQETVYSPLGEILLQAMTNHHGHTQLCG